MAVKTKALIIVITGLIIIMASQYISAIDAPHNTSHMNCGSCHGYEIFWVGTGSYDLLCQQCHWVSSCSPEGFSDTGAPQVTGHTDSNGNALAECRTCHDPHYQRQKNYKGTDLNNYYIAKGQFTACSLGSDTSILTYLSPITYKTETGWYATRLIGKTDICRRTILFPNVNKLGYSYPIIGVDEGANTITVKGNACEYLYLFPSNFAVIYGQYIKDSILTDAVNNTYSPVKFFDKIGQGSFAYDDDAINPQGDPTPNVDPTPNGVCQVCHNNTTHWKADGTGTDHYNNNVYEEGCIHCHSHTGGFAHGGGGTDCASCHGTTGSHSAHVSTIACDACHVFNPFQVRPGAGYSFTYNVNTNTCSDISCHNNTDAKWGKSACLYCHTISINNRAAITPQFNNANSHHIQLPQGVPLMPTDGAYCYQCHWEANSDGTINGLYHGGSKALGSVVDLVIYGGGSRPAGTTYTSGVTGIAYTANGSRGQIKSLNTHCLSCHNAQNSTITPITPFGDGKTPKEYAWDGTSVDERYSQPGTTTWGKYGQGIDITVIDESFEGAGYEEFSQGVKGNLATLDPDSAIPGTLPPDSGLQCLKSAVVLNQGKQAYAKRDLGHEITKTFTNFYLYVETAQDFSGTYKPIAVLEDSAGSNVIMFRLTNTGQLNFRIYYNSTWHEYLVGISFGKWYRIEVKYDSTNGTWEWSLKEIDGTIVSQQNGSLGTSHYTGIKTWNFGFYGGGTSGVTLNGAIYFDLITVLTQSGNFSPKTNQTKAYSAHGNAVMNQGGWDLTETWPNTRNGSEIVACFDCHNSHGSSVSGVTTSYTSATTNGGILKDTAGKGGYSMTYKPQSGGSTENKNAYNAGAGLCFDCHMNAATGTTPWGYNIPFGATQKIMGYRDTPYFGPGISGKGNKSGTTVTDTNKNFNLYLPSLAGYVVVISDNAGNNVAKGTVTSNTATSFTVDSWTALYGSVPGDGEVGYYFSVTGPQQRFTYKSLEPPYKQKYKGGHLGASYALSGLPGHLPPDKTTINGLCTPCHDPHGVSTSLGSNMQYGVPLLKGTWLTSPYREDRAPASNVAGSMRTDRGKEGAYNIDQNTFSSDIRDTVTGIAETDTQFAGLCLNCHTKNSLTDGTNSGTWKSIDRIHESVKGWGANVKHNYPCSKCHTPHNSRLPRLMITNCLDNRHKGRMLNNPLPVIDGSGHGLLTSPLDGYIACSGKSEELGYCPPVLYCSPNCDAEYCYRAPCDSYHILQTHISAGPEEPNMPGHGSGKFPGSWIGGWLVSSYPQNQYNDHYNYSVTCHENRAADQSWNNKTQWYDDKPNITSGPTAGPFTLVGTNIQVTITWTTDIASTSHVDYGLTTSYGSIAGDDVMVTSHSVTLTGLTNHSTYHYRIRSAGTLGTEAVSVDDILNYISFPPSVPSLIAEPDLITTNVTLQWNASTNPGNGGPVQYYAEIDDDPNIGSPNYNSGWISGTSWTIPGGLPNGYWSWRVKARDTVYTESESNWSSVDNFMNMAQPPLPTLIPEPDTVCSGPCPVTLEWNPVMSWDGHPVEYFVQVDDVSDFSSPNYQSNWISGTSWTVTLPTAKTWYWRVWKTRDSIHTFAESYMSFTYDSFVVMSSNPPPAPTLIDEPDVVVSSEPTSVTLQWNSVTDPDPGDTVEYNVQWSTSPTFSWSVYNSGWTSGTSWTASIGLGTWYWRVQARDKNHTEATSPYSTVDSFVISLQVPPAPTLIDEPDVVSAVALSVTLQWNSVTCPDGHSPQYYVDVDDASDFSSINYTSSWIAGSCVSGVCSWSVTVDTNKTWYWRVQARDSYFFHTSYVSEWSTSDSFSVLPHNPPAAPSLQAEPDIVTTQPTDVTLQWWSVTSPDGNPVEYYVEVDDDSNFGSINYTSGWVSGTGWTVTLPPGYWSWRVKARDKVHTLCVSPWSASDCFNTMQLPPAPVLIDEPNTVSLGQVAVTLEWNQVTCPDGDPVEYYVQVDDSTIFLSPNYTSNWISGNCVSGVCSWTVTVDPAITRTWYWRVQARDVVHTQAVSLWPTYDTFVVMSSNPPPAPTLIDEADIATPAPVSVTLEWSQVTDPDGDPVQYNVCVSQYSNFLFCNYTSNWITGNCVSGVCSWTTTITGANTWYWRVKARDQNHTEAVSDWSTPTDSFATLYGPPPAPILIDEPDVVSADPVTLQWNAITCPDGDPVDYQVQLDDSSSLFLSVDHDSGWITGDCVSGVCSWTVPVAIDKTWYWRVKARDALHTTSESSWSTVDSFMLTTPPIIDESFEGAGYEETWTEPAGNPNEDYLHSAIPGAPTPPTGAGSQCLQSISASTGYQEYATRVYGTEQAKTFTSFYLYVDVDGLPNDSTNKYKRIGDLKNNAGNDVFVLRLNKTTSNQLRFNLVFWYNNGGSSNSYFVNISTGIWYKIEVKYDTTNPGAADAWEWRFAGASKNKGNLTTDLSLLPYYSGIQIWDFGFSNSGQAYTGTIYYDLIKVSTVSYP